MLHTFFIGLPLLTILLGIPLALKVVPPNRFYGFRTATTFSSPEAWYQINFATGLALLAAGIVSGILVLVLGSGVIVLKPESRYLTGILITALCTVLFLIPVVVYSSGIGISNDIGRYRLRGKSLPASLFSLGFLPLSADPAETGEPRSPVPRFYV